MSFLSKVGKSFRNTYISAIKFANIRDIFTILLAGLVVFHQEVKEGIFPYEVLYLIISVSFTWFVFNVLSEYITISSNGTRSYIRKRSLIQDELNHLADRIGSKKVMLLEFNSDYYKHGGSHSYSVSAIGDNSNNTRKDVDESIRYKKRNQKNSINENLSFFEGFFSNKFGDEGWVILDDIKTGKNKIFADCYNLTKSEHVYAKQVITGDKEDFIGVLVCTFDKSVNLKSGHLSDISNTSLRLFKNIKKN